MTSYSSSHPYQFCNNCGKTGHSYNQCSKPITSNGVIAFTKSGKSVKYLIICRKDTLGYVEFLRGKYDERNEEYLIKIFNTMTNSEVERIKTLDFSQLWNELWSHRNYKQYQVEFENSKAKFENLIGGKYLDLEKIITLAEINYIEKEWGE